MAGPTTSVALPASKIIFNVERISSFPYTYIGEPKRSLLEASG